MIKEKSKQNKIIANLSMAIVLLLMFTIGMTFAYFTANRNATSGTMTFGTLEVEINNYTASSIQCHEPIVPGCTIALAGSITTGDDTNIDAFLRLKPTITVEQVGTGDCAQESAIISALQPVLIAAFENQGTWLRPIVNSEPSGEYLYYTDVFEAGDPAISLSGINIVIPTSFGNDWQNVEFTIGIEVEAIQAEHTGVTLTGTAQTDVNAIASTASTMAAWDAISGGQVAPLPPAPTVAPSEVKNLRFNIDESASVSKATSVSAGADEFWDSSNQLIIPDYILENNGKYYAYPDYSNSAYFATQSNEVTILGTSYTIHKVTSIEDSGFTHTTISSFVIPDTVKSIGPLAFKYTSLSSIVIPDSVTHIASSAFDNCNTIKNVVGDYEYIKAKPSIDAEVNEYYLLYKNTNKSITTVNNINSNCRIIGSSAFSVCSSLTQIEIPNGVTIIDEMAIYYCNALTSISIPNTVTTINNNVFDFCNSLTEANGSFYQYGNINYLGSASNNYLLAYNTISTDVVSCNIHNDTRFIHNKAFENCSNLTQITIPNGVKQIGYNAFYGCTNITGINIPSGVTSIGNMAFANVGATTITVDEGNSVYDSRNNCNAIIETNTNTLIAGCTSTIIPNTVTKIGDSAFYNCAGLTSINIPSSVTSIDFVAFGYCSDLENITIPSSITNLGGSVFVNCTSLNDVTLLNNTICSSMFEGCTSLEEFTIRSNITSISSSAFKDCSNLTSVIFDGVSQITEIKSYTFSGCSSLSQIIIPSSVTSIGDSAFSGCSSLSQITIPSNVTKIGQYAFNNCTSLSKVTFENTSGWWYSTYSTATSGTSITVTNTSTNANNLKTNYKNKYWGRTVS